MSHSAKSVDMQSMKQSNLALVYSVIRESRPISKADISRRTNLSPTSVASLVDELTQLGIVSEGELKASTAPGRRPTMLDLQPDGGYFAAVHVWPDELDATLYDMCSQQVFFLAGKLSDVARLGEEIIALVEQLLLQKGIALPLLMGIGVSVRGIVNPRSKRVSYSASMPLDESNEFIDAVSRHFSPVPVVLKKIASASAYGEMVHSREIKDLVFLEVDSGIGAGIIEDGVLREGYFGYEGEIGHTTMVWGGEPCHCGNLGCLEAYSSTLSICNAYLRQAGRPEVHSQQDLDRHFREFAAAFKAMDPAARTIAEQAARYLAQGIQTVTNISDPQAVVIGGMCRRLGTDYLDMVIQNLKQYPFNRPGPRFLLYYSQLGEQVSNVGMVSYLQDHLIEFCAHRLSVLEAAGQVGDAWQK